MRAIVTALTWEYWRRGWHVFLIALAMMIGFPLLFVSVIYLEVGPIPLGEELNVLPLYYSFLFLTFSLFGFGFAVLYAQYQEHPVRLPKGADKRQQDLVTEVRPLGEPDACVQS